MDRPVFNLAALCTITLSIILFCVIAGGYSSFARAQARIKEASSFLTEACEKRLVLFNELVELTDQTKVLRTKSAMTQSSRNAQNILHKMISQAPPVDRQLIAEFEISQNRISQQLITLLHQIETAPGNTDPERIAHLKKELNAVQDAIFVARKHYNTETGYFNTRTQMFPGFLIAKLFGLNHIRYTQLTEGTFLSGEKTFTSPAS
ncbi:MAG: LemA family protein [Proteobacteria bacterium]|nr:LemA family protein [Pseudomonadota bacterium]MBU1387037.1 LemA family protein [Pseudomonadota bacterium]MBU1542282.1 LemA family protein [Pseudomonadota bacterium]MBU2429615.1 LemA family protein [Pseudomonadota bacterium]MBU2479803.1 LemA family protein [Pseudomonadota bacterium]